MLRKFISFALSAAIIAAVGVAAFPVSAGAYAYDEEILLVSDTEAADLSDDAEPEITEPAVTEVTTAETIPAVTETTVTEITSVSDTAVTTSTTVTEIPPPPDIEYLYNDQATVFETIRMKRSLLAGDGESSMSDYEYMRDFLLRRHDGEKVYAKQVV
ncbi:MAG: hypothetical protein ACI4JB_02865, partial [Porcipelethomonas sp.]